MPLFESYLPLLEERISKRAYPKGIKCSVPCGYDISVNGNHTYWEFLSRFSIYGGVYLWIILNWYLNLSLPGIEPEAIRQLVSGFKQGNQFETLLGVTGSGKTFTMANVIQELNKPTLIIAHNKTLAAQLYSEFKAFFPHNAVEYFVSYYDYYQPEAYVLPQIPILKKTLPSTMRLIN